MAESESHRPVQEVDVAEPQASTSQAPTGGPRRFRQVRVRVGAVIAVAVAAGFIAWAAVGGGGGGGGDGSSPSAPTGSVKGTGPVVLSFSGLSTLAGAVGEPIYWVGTQPGTRYELRQTTDRKVYLRYLPAGVQAGDPRPFLTVGTYPVKDAFSVTQAASRGAGSTPLQAGNGTVAFYGRGSRTNGYVAFSGTDYQIEVYSPTPGLARRLIEQGAVTRVSGRSRVNPGTRAVSPGALRSLAKDLGQPIYWAGPRTGVTYEVRQAASGRIYVRYLPSGVKVGASGAYLTVATYPVVGAFAVTQGLGKSPGNTSLRVRGGGVAAYDERATTKNVYVAYPGADYQVEVFDPTAGRALELVRSGRISAIR